MTPREPRSQLAAFVGPTGGDPGTVSKHARSLWNSGGALILPYQMEALPAAARHVVEAEMEKAYGKRKLKNGGR